MADTEEKQEQVAAATDKEQAVQSEESSQVGSSDSEPQAERRDGTHDTKQSTPAEVLEPPASITQEADFDPAARHAPDSPTLSLITALRSQISLLTDQSSDLNAKLIAQLDRTSDLEDEIERSKAASQDQSKLIEELEAEKARWEESMNTGLLVERGTVRDEMQRLVEGLVEEERRRGSAEEGRQRVEREVDDLSATLFEQVSTTALVVARCELIAALAGQHDGRRRTTLSCASRNADESSRGESGGSGSCDEGYASAFAIIADATSSAEPECDWSRCNRTQRGWTITTQVPRCTHSIRRIRLVSLSHPHAQAAARFVCDHRDSPTTANIFLTHTTALGSSRH